MKFIVATSKVQIQGRWSEFVVKFDGRKYQLYMDGTPVDSFNSLAEAHHAALQLIAELEETEDMDGI